MLEFDGAKTTGRTVVIGNHSSGGYMFNGWIANFEVYDTVEMCDEFIQARMNYLCDHYGVEDSPYARVLEPEP